MLEYLVQRVSRAVASLMKVDDALCTTILLKDQAMSVFQALSLMIAFATLMVLIDRNNDRK
ncbi:putative holin-like toxin [Levilactobacillus namurensis]|uniref:putative holin-like toxin n=1 Tax=Levilactobacillus namurensis TaxID=380393 RepID=UPI00130E7F1A|nr:putative holin-like toxin [Levilactobacillus namurensis]